MASDRLNAASDSGGSWESGDELDMRARGPNWSAAEADERQRGHEAREVDDEAWMGSLSDAQVPVELVREAGIDDASASNDFGETAASAAASEEKKGVRRRQRQAAAQGLHKTRVVACLARLLRRSHAANDAALQAETFSRLPASAISVAQKGFLSFPEGAELLTAAGAVTNWPRGGLRFAATLRATGIPTRLVAALPVPPMALSSPSRSRRGDRASAEPTAPWREWVEVLAEKGVAQGPSSKRPRGRQLEWIPVAPREGSRVENSMNWIVGKPAPLYVVGIDENLRPTDVTRRYVREMATCVRERKRAATHGDWWGTVMRSLRPPIARQPHAEEATAAAAAESTEMEEFASRDAMEPIPTARNRFRGHPQYCLPSLLPQSESVPPSAQPVGWFRGEAVFLRKELQSVRTSRDWLRSCGRSVADAELSHPVGYRRRRRRRAQREPSSDSASAPASSETDGIPLFGYWQTEPFAPGHVEGGRVPKNEHGNVTLLHPACLPVGAAHIDDPFASKVATRLGVDAPSAVVGFETRNGRAVPVRRGIVVPQETRDLIVEGCAAMRQEEELKLARLRETRVVKRWKRMVHAALVHDRLRREYSSGPTRDIRPRDDEATMGETAPSAGADHTPAGEEVLPSSGQRTDPVVSEEQDPDTGIWRRTYASGFQEEFEVL